MTERLTAHLLQSTFFAIVAGLLTLVFRKNRAQVRYCLWLVASFKFFVPFALLISLGRYVETRAPSAHQFAVALPAVSWTLEQISQPQPPDRLTPTAPARATIPWIPVVAAAVWLIGVALISLVRLRTWLRIRATVSVSSPLEIGAPVSTAVTIRSSAGLLEPGVVGVIRPVLLLPEGIAERLTPSELKAVVAHELCHIRRRDNLFASVHMVVEAMFWFHPLVWWIGARLVEERERACDEEVLRMGNQPDVYADAILNVCKLYVESPLACVSGVTGAGIRRRIEAIMTNNGARGLNRAKKFLLVGAAGLAVAGPVLVGLVIGVGSVPVIRAQSSAQAAVTKLAFDVVSIRRCMPGDELNGPPGGRGGGGGRGPRFSPGRLRMQCLDLSDMILTAYIDLGTGPLLNFEALPGDPKWLRNAPAWAYSDWYTIDAETDNPAANGPVGLQSEGRKVLLQMLRTALEDRFHLKMHRDTEQVPMYDLTVAKGGLKLKPMEPGGCIPRDPSKGVMTSEMFPPNATPLCTNWLHMNGPDWKIDGAGQTLAALASHLSGALNRHVFDKTGVTDLFTYHLQFAHDDTTPGNVPPQIIARWFPPTDVPSGPSIFAVLEGVGLKLEPTKGPQGIIVVDHVERPSEN